jgi:hypothetical protein
MRQGHYTMIKGSLHQDDVTIITFYILNTRAPKYLKYTNRSEGRRKTFTFLHTYIAFYSAAHL